MFESHKKIACLVKYSVRCHMQTARGYKNHISKDATMKVNLLTSQNDEVSIFIHFSSVPGFKEAIISKWVLSCLHDRRNKKRHYINMLNCIVYIYVSLKQIQNSSLKWMLVENNVCSLNSKHFSYIKKMDFWYSIRNTAQNI